MRLGKTGFIWFQFLIGRLETKTIGVKRMERKVFQFLIGRLETVNTTISFSYHKLVSIPHR